MKIAVLSDIHANLVALKRVAADIESWSPDHVVMAGDLVNRGPRPAECLHLIRDKVKTNDWQLVRGNHEDYVIHQAYAKTARSEPAFEVHYASYWTYERLGYDVSYLEDMPDQQSLTAPDGSELRVVHASMEGNRVGIYPETTDEQLRTLIAAPDSPPPAVICVGHTHRPLIRRLKGTLVVNAGSAGLPFDGDTRPSYARLTWEHGNWDAEIIRLEYNLEKAEQDFFNTGYMPDAGPLVQLVLIELRNACSQLYNWSVRYQGHALEGRISMRDSVRQYLQQQEIEDDYPVDKNDPF